MLADLYDNLGAAQTYDNFSVEQLLEYALNYTSSQGPLDPVPGTKHLLNLSLAGPNCGSYTPTLIDFDPTSNKTFGGGEEF